jgi:hypothetical protein
MSTSWALALLAVACIAWVLETYSHFQGIELLKQLNRFNGFVVSEKLYETYDE